MLDPIQGFAMAASKTSGISAPPTVVPTPDKWEKIGDSGNTVLWVVFIIMVVSSVAFAILAWTVPLSKRLFHVITTLITVFAALSYFAMATGDGIGERIITKTHHHKHGLPDTYQDIHRQVFFARYIDWALTTPLLLIDLGLLAGMSGGHILIAVVADIIMVLTGLFASYSEKSGQRWGYYAFACIAFLGIVWQLAINGRKAASAQGKAGTLYWSLAAYTILVWTAYPVIWGVSEGGRLISINGEVIAYAVLDILAKPVFGFWLLLAHKAISDAQLELGGFWSNGLGREGAVRLEDDDGA